MTVKRYWFSRLRTPQGPGRGVTPISWQGYAVIAGFVAAMVCGGLALLLLGLADRFFLGIAIFVLLALAGSGTFLWAATAKTVLVDPPPPRPK